MAARVADARQRVILREPANHELAAAVTRGHRGRQAAGLPADREPGVFQRCGNQGASVVLGEADLWIRAASSG